jgi:MFS transporter, putative metabolite:H+ symporter
VNDLSARSKDKLRRAQHDALAALDHLPVNRFHWRLLLLSGLGWMFDGMDTILLSLVLPALALDWQLSAAQVGFIGTVDRFGALCGAALAGLLADRYGRRMLFQASLLVYSLGSGVLALTANLPSFLFVRFLVGLGLGGELPVVATLITESVPARERGRLLAILSSFFSYGWLLAALIGYLVIPSLGWQAAFVAGALPAFYVFVLRRAIPESPRYLIAKGRQSEAIEILQRMGVKEKLSRGDGQAALDSADSRSGVKLLFAPLYLHRTVWVWILWFSLFFTFYGIFIWLPTLLLARGLGLVRSLEYVLLMTCAQVPGYFVAGYLADRVGRRWTFVGLILLSAASAAMFGVTAAPAQVLFWGVCLNFFYPGTYALAYAYTAELYETTVRATGTGWATAFGRIGAAIAPLTVGVLLQSVPGAPGQALVFYLMVGFFILAAIAMLALTIETKNRSLETLTAC